MILKYRLIILFIFLTFFSTSAQKETSDFEQLYAKLENTPFSNSNFESLLIQALELANSEKNEIEIAQMYDWAINVYSDSKVILYYSNLYEELGKKSQNKQWIIRALQGKAYAYTLDRNYNQSLIYELEALHLIEELNQPYFFYSSLYSIGTTKLYMEQHKEVLEIFKKTTAYFEAFKNYNEVLAYFNSKRLEALCYFYLNDYVLAQEKIEAGFKEMHRLKPTDKPLEISYFKLTQAMILYKQGQYDKSIKYLNEALPEIKKNEDFANENLAYLYLGKNEWKIDNREEAITYFIKIDQLFNDKKFITTELKKAYNYLIENANEQMQLKKELYYTNQLLAVTTHLQIKHSKLSNTFYKENEIQKNILLKNKEELTQVIAKNNNRNMILFIIGFLIVIILLFIVYRSSKRSKKLRLQFEKLKTKYDLNQIDIDKKNCEKNQIELHHFANELNLNLETPIVDVEKKVNQKRTIDIDELPEKLVKEFNTKLIQFEKNRDYLQQDVSLATLAEKWSTNRSYLSKYFNQYKNETFNSYINNLRVDYAILKLHSDLKFRKYSLDALALEFGFSKRRHFSDVFTKKTGITPSYYIQQLEKDINLESKVIS